MKQRIDHSGPSVNRLASLLAVVGATALGGACSPSTSDPGEPATTVTTVTTETTISTSIVPEVSVSSAPVVLMVSGLEPLGEGASYLLVGYDGDQWRSGGAFDVEGDAVVLEDGTTELVVHAEYSNLAILVRSDDEDDQLAEAYWVADGSVDGTSSVELVDVSGRDQIKASLTFSQ